jgi:hypothetical protein
MASPTYRRCARLSSESLSRGIAATHRFGCQSIEHVGGCKLVPPEACWRFGPALHRRR